ncbi:MAG: DciA family protein [Alphaproteobacteria bacterium]
MRKNSLQSMAVIAKKMARVHLGRSGMVAVDVMTHWRDIVGEEFYHQVHFQKITFPVSKDGKSIQAKTDGVLVILCDAGVAHLIKFEEKNILERANRYFGYAALCRIRVKQKLS